jgi:hypothetical protein
VLTGPGRPSAPQQRSDERAASPSVPAGATPATPSPLIGVAPVRLSPAHVLALQRTAGNVATQRALARFAGKLTDDEQLAADVLHEQYLQIAPGAGAEEAWQAIMNDAKSVDDLAAAVDEQRATMRDVRSETSETAGTIDRPASNPSTWYIVERADSDESPAATGAPQGDSLSSVPFRARGGQPPPAASGDVPMGPLVDDTGDEELELELGDEALAWEPSNLTEFTQNDLLYQFVQSRGTVLTAEITGLGDFGRYENTSTPVQPPDGGNAEDQWPERSDHAEDNLVDALYAREDELLAHRNRVAGRYPIVLSIKINNSPCTDCARVLIEFVQAGIVDQIEIEAASVYRPRNDERNGERARERMEATGLITVDWFDAESSMAAVGLDLEAAAASKGSGLVESLHARRRKTDRTKEALLEDPDGGTDSDADLHPRSRITNKRKRPRNPTAAEPNKRARARQNTKKRSATESEHAPKDGPEPKKRPRKK